MFPVNTHDFYGGGCSCCSGKGKFFDMEEEAVTMPVVDISFAPTKAFVGAFGEAEARKQGEKFVQPTWAQKLRLPSPVDPADAPGTNYTLLSKGPVHITKLSDEQVKAYGLPVNPLLTREEHVAQEAQQVPREAILVVGGIFLAGAVVALLAAWRLGALSTATFTSQ